MIKTSMKKLAFMSLVSVYALLLSGCGSNKSHSAKTSDVSDIYIIHTSDVHCGFDTGFGYASVKQIRDKLEADGAATILVDGGDFVQGDSVGTLSKNKSEAAIPIMNALGYDLAVPGNHEFDYGMDELYKLVDLADFPIICCNFKKNDNVVFEPYIIKDVAGMKIAFVGVTTPETFVNVSPEVFKDNEGNYIYGFMQGDDGNTLFSEVQKAVDGARAEGADVVYVVGHMGDDSETDLYSYEDVIVHTSGIDVFLDGHSHDTVRAVVKNKEGKDVVRVACGKELNAIGYSHINVEDGSIETGIWTWDNTISAPKLLGIKNEISDLVTDKLSKIDEQLRQILAVTDAELTINDPDVMDDEGNPIRRVRNKETNLGDLCADAIRECTGADVGFVNGRTIRSNIDKGKITYEAVLDAQPFGDEIFVLEVSGQQIADALEWSCRRIPDEEGGFLQVSGITFMVDVTIESTCTEDEEGLMTGVTGNRRVHDITVGGNPIELDRMYKVAGNETIMVKHGNGYTAFDGCTVIKDDAGTDNQMLVEYLSNTLGGKVGEEYADPHGQGRIMISE